jgi:hypothetical protein
MEQSFSDLFKMDKCSPLMAYGVIVVITAICIYNVRSEFNRVGHNPKIKNINDMFMWYEIALLLVTGVIMYGLCQYNEATLAWLVLFAPLLAYTIKTVIVFLSVSSVQTIIPPAVDPNIPSNMHPSNAGGSQQALADGIRRQSAIQTPQQVVSPAFKMGNNTHPGLVPPLNSKSSEIAGLNSMQSNAW